MKKILGPILLVVLLLGVGAAIFFSAQEQFTEKSIVSIRGLIGSEKEAFFKDPRVVEALRKAHLDVQVEKAGSREIASKIGAAEYDFVSPSGVPAAEKIRREHEVSGSYEVFFTPMVIASWHPIANILEANGIVTSQGRYPTLDVAAFLEMFAEERRWEDLQDNDIYDVSKIVMISSTDVRSSNSAAMYLALASFVANDNTIVTDAEIDEVLPEVETLFLKQGFQAGSSAVPFNDYLTMGVGKAPLVMIYESQFIYQATTGSGVQPEMALIYPEPTIYTKHFIIGLNEHGDLLGKLLRNDPDLQNDPDLREVAATLQKLEIEHGFRNSDTAYFLEFTEKHDVEVPEMLGNVIDPPTYEVLEEMIQRIEQKY